MAKKRQKSLKQLRATEGLLSKKDSARLLSLLKREADKVLSLHIRQQTLERYGGCPLCLDDRKQKGLSPAPIQCAFHFISRRISILRWREDNLVGACHLCNYIENYVPDFSRAWYIQMFGHEKYLDLVVEAKARFEPTISYLEDLLRVYGNR